MHHTFIMKTDENYYLIAGFVADYFYLKTNVDNFFPEPKVLRSSKKYYSFTARKVSNFWMISLIQLNREELLRAKIYLWQVENAKPLGPTYYS